MRYLTGKVANGTVLYGSTNPITLGGTEYVFGNDASAIIGSKSTERSAIRLQLGINARAYTRSVSSKLDRSSKTGIAQYDDLQIAIILVIAQLSPSQGRQGDLLHPQS